MYLNFIENIIIVGIIISSNFVLISINPIQSLLYIMLVFILSSMVFMILGAEFMSLLIFIVYIGAIAVLFLFVIMMLNVKIVELRSLYLKYIYIGIFIVLFFFFELFLSIYLEFIFIDYKYFYID
jgi:NADH-quinone oxidoreductase subunit J